MKAKCDCGRYVDANNKCEKCNEMENEARMEHRKIEAIDEEIYPNHEEMYRPLPEDIF